MGIRETLGVGENTKIKLVDRQRNRLDEEVEIINKNINNSKTTLNFFINKTGQAGEL